MMIKPLDKEKAKIILFEIKEILDKLSIEFWLLHGTCLGIYRDGAFCDGDNDIDLGVKHEIIVPRMKELKTVFQEHGYSVMTVLSPFKYERAIRVSKSGIKTDILDWTLNGSDRFCPHDKKNFCQVYEASLFENMSTVKFYDREFLIPTPVEKYLEASYGKTWRTPQPGFFRKLCRVSGYWSKTSFGKNQELKGK